MEETTVSLSTELLLKLSSVTGRDVLQAEIKVAAKIRNVKEERGVEFTLINFFLQLSSA